MFVHWSLFSYLLYGVGRHHILGVSYYQTLCTGLSVSLSHGSVRCLGQEQNVCHMYIPVLCIIPWGIVLEDGGHTWQLVKRLWIQNPEYLSFYQRQNQRLCEIFHRRNFSVSCNAIGKDRWYTFFGFDLTSCWNLLKSED